MKLPNPTKLTLRLDSALIHRAKHYAQEQDRSLSQLVADYFAHLAGKPRAGAKPGRASAAARPGPGPIATGLRGALKQGGRAGAPLTLSRADHRAHLEEKYR